jgi:hypothetical protein
MVGVNDERRFLVNEVGGLALPAGRLTGLAFHVAFDALGCPGQLDVAVALDRRLALDGSLGFGDLFVDTRRVRRARSARYW